MPTNKYIAKIIEPLGLSLAKLNAAKPENKRQIIKVPITTSSYAHSIALQIKK